MKNAMLSNEKYSIYIPPSSHWFLFKIFQHFLLKICHKNNIIMRCKLRSYFCSTFLFESFSSNSDKLFFKTTSASSVNLSLEICFVILVSKNLRRDARSSPCGMLGERQTASMTLRITSSVKLLSFIYIMISVLNVRFRLLSKWLKMIL